jgi:8-oxo-dGTP pyrophosphatase MutT (NUDIX family)
VNPGGAAFPAGSPALRSSRRCRSIGGVPSVPTDPYASEAVASAIPAATVVPLRDGPGGLETVMLRRDTGLSFAGGLWVWPGGRIDEGDGDLGGDDPLGSLTAAARMAAVREAHEEARLLLDPADLEWFAHFTPPIGPQRRYATFFFATRVDGDPDIVPDGQEVHEHRWFTPSSALDACRRGDIGLSPPTWIVLEWLATYRSVDDAVAGLTSEGAQWCVTRFGKVEGGTVAMYHGDAGYESGDPSMPGDRHRLWILDDGWRYERTGWPS